MVCAPIAEGCEIPHVFYMNNIPCEDCPTDRCDDDFERPQCPTLLCDNDPVPRNCETNTYFRNAAGLVCRGCPTNGCLFGGGLANGNTASRRTSTSGRVNTNNNIFTSFHRIRRPAIPQQNTFHRRPFSVGSMPVARINSQGRLLPVSSFSHMPFRPQMTAFRNSIMPAASTMHTGLIRPLMNTMRSIPRADNLRSTNMFLTVSTLNRLSGETNHTRRQILANHIPEQTTNPSVGTILHIHAPTTTVPSHINFLRAIWNNSPFHSINTTISRIQPPHHQQLAQIQNGSPQSILTGRRQITSAGQTQSNNLPEVQRQDVIGVVRNATRREINNQTNGGHRAVPQIMLYPWWSRSRGPHWLPTIVTNQTSSNFRASASSGATNRNEHLANLYNWYQHYYNYLRNYYYPRTNFQQG